MNVPTWTQISITIGGRKIVGEYGHNPPHHQPATACPARFALRDNHIVPGGTDWPRGVKTTAGKFT